MALATGESGVCLRYERGLRRGRGTEPPPSFARLLRRTGVVGRAPQTTMNDRRVNTMKTYILRDFKTVEQQNRKAIRGRRGASIPA